MATERTAMAPDDSVVFLEVNNEQYQTPEGHAIDGGLDAPAGGVPFAVFLNSNQVID